MNLSGFTYNVHMNVAYLYAMGYNNYYNHIRYIFLIKTYCSLLFKKKPQWKYFFVFYFNNHNENECCIYHNDIYISTHKWFILYYVQNISLFRRHETNKIDKTKCNVIENWFSRSFCDFVCSFTYMFWSIDIPSFTLRI